MVDAETHLLGDKYVGCQVGETRISKTRKLIRGETTMTQPLPNLNIIPRDYDIAPFLLKML